MMLHPTLGIFQGNLYLYPTLFKVKYLKLEYFKDDFASNTLAKCKFKHFFKQIKIKNKREKR